MRVHPDDGTGSWEAVPYLDPAAESRPRRVAHPRALIQARVARIRRTTRRRRYRTRPQRVS
jgi:hypothetical protein